MKLSCFPVKPLAGDNNRVSDKWNWFLQFRESKITQSLSTVYVLPDILYNIIRSDLQILYQEHHKGPHSQVGVSDNPVRYASSSSINIVSCNKRRQ